MPAIQHARIRATSCSLRASATDALCQRTLIEDHAGQSWRAETSGPAIANASALGESPIRRSDRTRVAVPEADGGPCEPGAAPTPTVTRSSRRCNAAAGPGSSLPSPS